MLTAARFRSLALGLEEAVEGAHMGHPDFRVGGRIFATLQPGPKTGMVKLTPEEQRTFVRDHPTIFMPESVRLGPSRAARGST